jgi:hypothetical protein
MRYRPMRSRPSTVGDVAPIVRNQMDVRVSGLAGGRAISHAPFYPNIGRERGQSFRFVGASNFC